MNQIPEVTHNDYGPTPAGLVRVKDSDGCRWYAPRGHEANPSTWYASVTNILSVAVPAWLQAYFKRNDEKTQEARLKKAADYGTTMHEVIERNLRRDPSNNAALERSEVFQSWLKLKTEHGITAESIELPVYSKLGFAGTIDIIGNYDGKKSILDLKTGNFNVKAGFQLAAYRQAYYEMTGEQLPIVGIQIKRDGSRVQTFVYEHFDWTLKSFLATFEVWKALNYWKLDHMKWVFLHKDTIKVILPEVAST